MKTDRALTSTLKSTYIMAAILFQRNCPHSCSKELQFDFKRKNEYHGYSFAFVLSYSTSTLKKLYERQNIKIVTLTNLI